MAQPTEKSQTIDNFIISLMGKDRRTIIENNQCMFCETPNMDFRDNRSRREYQISGLCQNCQDDYFD